MNTVSSISSNPFGMTGMSGTSAAKNADKTGEQQENGIIKALKPKFAHSREEMIQNQIDDLREQLSALADADEIDEKTKENMRKGINEQISGLNVELMDLRKQRMEKEAEKKAEGSADRSKKFDRYEPSEALKNMKKAASADVALEQTKIQKNAAGRLESRQKVVKNELDADVASGAATVQKEEELVDIKSRLRNAGNGTYDSLNDTKDDEDEPTFMTFNTGLLWIEELRQKSIEQRNSAITGMEAFMTETDNGEKPFIISGDTISGVPVKTLEESDIWGI